jgi:hypothetical protein
MEITSSIAIEKLKIFMVFSLLNILLKLLPRTAHADIAKTIKISEIIIVMNKAVKKLSFGR